MDNSVFNPEELDKEFRLLFEGIEGLDEHHIETNDARITFILNNSDQFDEAELNNMSKEEVENIYFPLCDEIFGKQDDNGETSNAEAPEDADSKVIIDVEKKSPEPINESNKDENFINDVLKDFKTTEVINEEKKSNAMLQVDKIKGQNEKNSLGYYKTLNKGTQKMIDNPDSDKAIDFENDFDKDSGTVGFQKRDNTKDNEEYIAKVHRGMEDLNLDTPDEKYEERLKDAMGNSEVGKEMYKNKEDKQDFIKKHDLRNTPNPGRMEIVKKVPVNESTNITGVYTDNHFKRHIIGMDLKNINDVSELNESDFYKVETKGLGNVFINEEIESNINKYEFFINKANLKEIVKIVRQPKKIKIDESEMNKIKAIMNYSSKTDQIKKKRVI